MKITGPSMRSVLGASGLLLIFSFFFPYWEALLVNGSQADALQVTLYVNHVDGPLCERVAADDLRRLESSTTAAAVVTVVLLVLAIALARRPWSLLLCLPAILLPAVVCADFAGFRVAGYTGELVARPGAGAFIAWGAAALLIGGGLRELWGIWRGKPTG